MGQSTKSCKQFQITVLDDKSLDNIDFIILILEYKTSRMGAII